MYEAKQNKEKRNRGVVNNIKKADRYKNKVSTPNYYVNQMMLTRRNEGRKSKIDCFRTRFADINIEHQDASTIFIEKLNYFIQEISKSEFNSQLSFYGVYFGSMGPHTIAHSSLKKTIDNLSKEGIADKFCQLIQTPDQIQTILANETIFYPVSEYNENLGLNSPRLNSYIKMYSELYNTCSGIAEYFQSNINFINEIEQPTYSDENAIYTSQIEQLWKYLQDNMVYLLNLNPYATYAWHRTTGYTDEEIRGKGESSCNLFDITEEDFPQKIDKFFDKLSLCDITFYDIDGFINYICVFFPNIEKSNIKVFLLSNRIIQLPNVPIEISEDEIDNYFIDMQNVNYTFSLKKIATMSIIRHVDIIIFAKKILQLPDIMDVLDQIFTILSYVYDEFVEQVSQLVSQLMQLNNDEQFIDIYNLLEKNELPVPADVSSCVVGRN
ncbi:hypothetical protein [Bacteroides timonensis]|uniref:hypothetical protein n=1 Tax=Bacteroides timonensis TaxID=1470345 RepID=UPI0004B676A1|nr:hypothetical protein [Bacteroides timonensis]